MTELYIGLMSGTSADGINAVLVEFNQSNPVIIAADYAPYSFSLREKILSLCHPGDNEIERLGELDVLLGKAFADAVKNLLKTSPIPVKTIKAIGSHGQTIRHAPRGPHCYTIQIGDPNTIAAETGITTIADFRRKDIALGGQGAPLVPAFHQHVLSSKTTHRAIVNIGGIANVTLLSHQTHEQVIGFDTGPGNILMDTWINQHQQKPYDSEGAWAAQGIVHAPLLENLLTDAYFILPPPKSTGREYFNLAWLKNYLHRWDTEINPVDVQTTLVELTAISIMKAIRQHLPDGEILICGGGAHNTYLMKRLQQHGQPRFTLDSTKKHGIEPDWVEAVAFAWLAKQTMHRCTGNLPSVTGATQRAILGGIYFY